MDHLSWILIPMGECQQSIIVSERGWSLSNGNQEGMMLCRSESTSIGNISSSCRSFVMHYTPSRQNTLYNCCFKSNTCGSQYLVPWDPFLATATARPRSPPGPCSVTIVLATAAEVSHETPPTARIHPLPRAPRCAVLRVQAIHYPTWTSSASHHTQLLPLLFNWNKSWLHLSGWCGVSGKYLGLSSPCKDIVRFCTALSMNFVTHSEEVCQRLGHTQCGHGCRWRQYPAVDQHYDINLPILTSSNKHKVCYRTSLRITEYDHSTGTHLKPVYYFTSSLYP